MKIVVCVNHVPDTATKVNISSDQKTIDPTGVTYVLNPYDEFAIEEALKTKEAIGGEVIAISGNEGELTTGPHLHFELWSNGYPIDPTVFIDFE